MRGRDESTVFVGQGPNEASWKESLKLASAHLLRPDYTPEMFAIQRGRRLALTGQVGQKIARLLDMHRLEFLARYDRFNLNDRWNGKDGLGDKFDRVEAAGKAAQLMMKLYGRYVLLGKEPARAFLFIPEDCEPLATATHESWPGREFFFLPHPSGLNHWWNAPGNRARAAEKLKAFLKL